ncbi:MAG: toll/interleukin-1 receptor domain-containing protein [Candidatus Acidiferrales bacterium]
MDPSSKKIFVSYVEEDGDVAHEIAQHLEAHGYSSWYYERDCPAGADYFEETFKAISDCEAMAIIISPRSLPSDQITREIVRAVEANKATLPLLLDLTHDEYAHRRPGWKQAMAAANATRLRAKEIPSIIPALVAGLHAKGIKPHPGAAVPPAPAALPQSGVIAAPAVSPQSGVVAVPDFSPKSGVIAAPDFAPVSTSSGTIVVPPQRTEMAPTRDAQIATVGSGPLAVAGGKFPLIPIAVGAAVLIAVFAGWHFLKPKPKIAVVPPAAPVGATVMLRYNADRHMCTPDLNMILAGKSYHLATNPYAVSGVPLGVQHYTIDGVVSCPNRHPSKASGGGDINVREGAVFDMNWQAKPGGVGIMDVVDASTEPVSTAPLETTHVTHAPASPPPTAVVQQADPAKPLLVKANAAYAQGRYFEPANDSALHWAILAGRAGSPAGKTMEQQLGNLFRAQVTQLFQQQNYPAALHLVNALLIYYPGNAELVGDQQKLLAAQNGGPVQQVQMNQAMQQLFTPGQHPPAGYPNPAQRSGPGAPSQSAYDAAVRAQARAAAQAALAQQRAAQSQSRPH